MYEFDCFAEDDAEDEEGVHEDGTEEEEAEEDEDEQDETDAEAEHYERKPHVQKKVRPQTCVEAAQGVAPQPRKAWSAKHPAPSHRSSILSKVRALLQASAARA